jgi:hypothetical protein
MINWKYFGRVHKILYKLSGGRFGAGTPGTRPNRARKKFHTA